MPQISKIPEPILSGLKEIINLDDGEFLELTNNLQSVPPVIFSPKYITQITPDVSNLSQSKVETIIEAATAMSLTYVSSNIAMPDFVDDILDALERGIAKGITFDSGQKQFIGNRLRTLLNLGVFKAGAKATDVLAEHENTLRGARILTDIRPVFGDDINTSPISAILVNNLKIDYAQAGEIKEFFVAMDAQDIQMLIDVLERAKSKAEKLKSTLVDTQFHLIDFT